ncbi:serine hydrolase domain-containing protein [Actinomadura sp. 6N118]|uniref:serine hydrolase domain-containing protein n=1 Tax=Actinomadura sp. 6N118 TaxID=3375151 RepID=UPI00378F1F18
MREPRTTRPNATGPERGRRAPRSTIVQPTRRQLAPLAVIVAAALAAGCATSTTTRPAAGAEPAVRTVYGKAELQRDADAIRALGVTGVQARVTAQGRPDIVATSGVGDRRTGRPVPPNGYFRIGSSTKTFVATVVLQLVGEGRLSLDDTVERRLPGVVHGKNDGNKITVRHLLQHTSGIHDDMPSFSSAADYYRHRYDVYSPEQLVARAMRHPPDFEPGKKGAWNYSGTGYLLLGMIIERVTGRPWHKAVEQRIINKLGLTGMVWPYTSPAVPRPHARAYERFKAGEPLVDVTSVIDANSAHGYIGKTADLDRFFRALLSGRLLNSAGLAQMRDQPVPVQGPVKELWPDARSGLGLFSRTLPCGGEYWGHSGDLGGYMTRNGFTADGRRGVVISMSTEQTDSPDNFMRQDKAASTLIENALCAKQR